MLMIISPAKTLDFTKENKAGYNTNAIFCNEIEELISVLEKYSIDDLSKLMKMSEKLAEENYDRYQKFFTDKIGCKEALLAFDGAVYKGIDAKSFNCEDLEYAQRNLRILSGLYGVIRPLDMIKEYRLEMGTKLKFKTYKSLYNYWGDKLTNFILKEIESSSGDKVLINIASNEYSKALDLKEINRKYKVVSVEFKEKRDDEYKVVGTYAKKARGLLVNYIIKNRIIKVEDIKAFNKEDYIFNSELSNDLEFIFTRG